MRVYVCMYVCIRDEFRWPSAAEDLSTTTHSFPSIAPLPFVSLFSRPITPTAKESLRHRAWRSCVLIPTDGTIRLNRWIRARIVAPTTGWTNVRIWEIDRERYLTKEKSSTLVDIRYRITDERNRKHSWVLTERKYSLNHHRSCIRGRKT